MLLTQYAFFWSILKKKINEHVKILKSLLFFV